MKPTIRATGVLLMATIAAVGCSKKDASSQQKTGAPTLTQAAAQSDDFKASKPIGEDDVAADTAKFTGPVTFTDGEAAFQAKKYGDATAIFDRYVEQRPKNVWGHYMRGLSAWKSGDVPKAEQAFQTALDIEPSHVKTLLNYSRLFIEHKQHDEAIELLTRAAEAEPESMVVYRLLGRTYAVKGDTDEAMKAYAKAIEINDLDAWSMNNLGLLHLDAQQVAEAVTWFTKAIDVRPSVPSFHNNLGMALEHAGQFRAAATAYSEALAVDPSYAKAKKNLARVEAVRTADEGPFEIASDEKPASK
jgi:tetratricopeptide (TPR) repeat protein